MIIVRMVSQKVSTNMNGLPPSKKIKIAPAKNEENDWSSYKDAIGIEQSKALLRSTEEDVESYISICDKIQELLQEINAFKSEEKEDEKKEELEQKRVYICTLLVSLKKINRLDKLRMSFNRNQLQEKRKQVDSSQLQLQNLLYEEEYLKKEILKCNQIRSNDDDIDMISIDEFYNHAPESISKPDITKNDDHQLQLSRLEWELEQRKNLTSTLDDLKSSIDQLNEKISEKQHYLDAFNPLIKQLSTVSSSLVDYMADNREKNTEKMSKLKLLPSPLFTLYSEINAFRQVFDMKINLKVIGNEDLALELKEIQEIDDFDGSESESEEEMDYAAIDVDEDDNDNKKRHHIKTSQKDKFEKKRKHITDSHPLSIELIVESKSYPDSKLSVVFDYIKQLNIVTVKSKIHLGPNISTGVCAGDIIESPNILKELFTNDTGSESPNPSNKYLFRKYNMDFSEIDLNEIGYPYIWAQKLCGLDFQTEKNLKSEPKTVHALIDNNMEQVVKTLFHRLDAKLALSMQIQTLETRSIPVTNNCLNLKLQSSIVFWKYINWEDYCANDTTKLYVQEQLVNENDLLYQIAIIKAGAKLLAYVSVKDDYPKVMPIFSLKLNFNQEFNAGNCDAIRDMERAINTNFHKDFYQKNDYYNLLALQIRKLMYFFELFLEIQFPNEFPTDKIFLKKYRGRNRTLPFKVIDQSQITITH